MNAVEGNRNRDLGKGTVVMGIASAAQAEQAEQGMGWCSMTSLSIDCRLLFGIEVVWVNEVIDC